MKEEINKGFQLLGLTEENYPEYSDPDSFAMNFKICSLLEDSDITTSNSSIVSGSAENNCK